MKVAKKIMYRDSLRQQNNRLISFSFFLSFLNAKLIESSPYFSRRGEFLNVE